MSVPKILVVEDEVIVAKTIAGQLKQLGYIVVDTASSGMAAISKAAAAQPDLILMDIVLKGEMDGVAAATQIRAQRDVPIIYLTAYADDNTLQRAKLTQPFGYIVKPFTSNDLRVAIEIGLFKHQVSQELQEQRGQLETLLQSMSDAVIATNAQGNITFMNPAVETLTGWQQDESSGRAVDEVFQIVDEVTEVPAENPVEKVLQEEHPTYFNNFITLVLKSGDRVPIGGSASPLKRATGEISGVVLVFRDMRDRRQAELLTQALEKEKELNQVKSQFISIVSHEFRNPLAVVRTAAELLEKGHDLPEQKKNSYIQRIKTSVRSMNDLMEDVLLMGQVEADRVTCNPTLLNLEQFCRNLVEEFSIVEGSLHTLIFNCQASCTDVWMDERILRYILSNLLSNAIKYSAAGTTVQLDLTVVPTEKLVIFQIRDEGIGIPEADQPRLFDSFFRASNVKSIQGTGLGLAIVKRCVEANRGEIQVSSQVGLGTTITVKLATLIETEEA